MTTPTAFDHHHELMLFQALESGPETTQADLAAQVGVAVGTVNWYLKRWTAKGFVKIRRIGRWNWHYLLTSHGIAEKARLTASYLEVSLSLYRETRDSAKRLLGEVRAAGYGVVVILGEGELADICRLSCLELALAEADQAESERWPRMVVNGTKLSLEWPAPQADASAAGGAVSRAGAP